MPKRRSALKRLRADKKRRQRNVKVKRVLKKTIKKYSALASEKKSDETQSTLKKVYSLLDKAAKKRIIHPKLADRRKSRLAKKAAKTK